MRTASVLCYAIMGLITGCSHFATTTKTGTWQHPVVAATPTQIEAAVTDLPSPPWSKESWDKKLGRLALTYTTPRGFVDDVVLRFTGDGKKTQVAIHSASRVGLYDFGQNKKHVLAVIELLDRNFGLIADAEGLVPPFKAPAENKLQADDRDATRLPE